MTTTAPLITFAKVERAEPGMFKVQVTATVLGSNWEMTLSENDHGEINLEIVQNARKHNNGCTQEVSIDSCFSMALATQRAVCVFYSDNLIAETNGAGQSYLGIDRTVEAAA